MTHPVIRLTRQALVVLKKIHAHSLTQWGEKTADRYMSEIYAVVEKTARNPDFGRVRFHRSAPFFMVPTGRHFIVYDRIANGIIVLTLLHQSRNIEKTIADLEPAFWAEIKALEAET